MTAHAEPDRLASQRRLSIAQLNLTDNLIRQQVHVLRERTTPAAGQAMPAQAEVLPGHMIDDLQESLSGIIGMGVDIQTFD